MSYPQLEYGKDAFYGGRKTWELGEKNLIRADLDGTTFAYDRRMRRL